MSKKEEIKKWFETHPNEWISTREMRMKYGEASDRRIREIKSAGFEIVSKRSERPDGSVGFTFYWMHPVGQQKLY